MCSMKWLIPETESSSSRLPAAIHTPTDMDRTDGIRSETTRRPFPSSVLRYSPVAELALPTTPRPLDCCVLDGD
jgi:hypothetical protein